MPKLILLRHFKSQWNLENRFTGWVDVPLCKEGLKKTKEIAKKISKVKIDVIYSSPLIRNLESVLRILEYNKKKHPIFKHFQGRMKKWDGFKKINKNYFPIYISESLNERYYGRLQGLNKAETIRKCGVDKVRLWRRSFKVPPPGGESLELVFKRTIPFYRKYIEEDLKEGKNVLVVTSHNPLRALIKYIEKISDKDIINVEVPYAGLVCYEFKKGVYKRKNL